MFTLPRKVSFIFLFLSLMVCGQALAYKRKKNPTQKYLVQAEKKFNQKNFLVEVKTAEDSIDFDADKNYEGNKFFL